MFFLLFLHDDRRIRIREAQDMWIWWIRIRWIRIRIRIRNTDFLLMKPLKRSPICWAPSQGQLGWPAWELATSPTVTVLVSDTDTGHVSAAKTRLVRGIGSCSRVVRGLLNGMSLNPGVVCCWVVFFHTDDMNL
jgi:hypothetical protein